MLKKTLTVRPDVKVFVPNVSGDLRLTGWDREEVSAKSGGDVLDLVLDGGRVTVSCDDDLILNIPRSASAQVDNVDGDVDVRMLAGELTIGAVTGDLSLREAGPLTLSALDGDLAIRSCAGSVTATRVDGDVSIRDVKGSVTLDSVAEDLFARGVMGAIRARVEDDVVLHLEPKAGNAVDIVSEGDILLHVSAKANATLTLTADDPEDIKVQVPAASVSGVNPRSVVLGDGSGSIINLSAEGDILVTSESQEWESAAEFDFGSNWPLPDDFAERINRRVQEAAARRVEAGARRVEERMRGPRFAFNWTADGRPVMPPMPPAEPVSDVERMTILKMLQEKKITSDEAEKLLSALEGGK
jgi:DUF4097 and DUF4098 domain-containing protein YvlB